MKSSQSRHGALERDNTRAFQILTAFRGALQTVPIPSIVTSKLPLINGFDCLHLRISHSLYRPASAVQFPLTRVETLLSKCSAAAHEVLQHYARKHFQNGPQDWRSKVQLQPPHRLWGFPKGPASYRKSLYR